MENYNKIGVFIAFFGLLCGADRAVAGAESTLRKAAEVGDVATVRRLIAAGTDVNALNPASFFNARERPLHLAASNGYVEIAQLLIDAGANVNATNSYMKTPLLYAVKGGHEGVAQLLLDAGADVEEEDVSGMSLLHYAARCGLEVVVRRLIRADINIEGEKNMNGERPLHLAVKLGQEAVARTLVERGADITAKCLPALSLSAAVNSERTPLELCRSERLRKELQKISDARQNSVQQWATQLEHELPTDVVRSVILPLALPGWAAQMVSQQM